MTKIVVVTGAGRSGTSSVAGSLKRLGLHVPQPEKPADEWNPRGYYESSWPTTFHARWLKPLLRDMDARPHAAAVALASITAEREERFSAWVRGQVEMRAPGEQVLVKETRAYWVLPMWQRAAASAGAELVSLTMLRHPAQVVRSRDAKHQSGQPDEFRSLRTTTNVAAWLNALFVTELATRPVPRTFVLYDELVADWRAALGRASKHLGVTLDDGAGALAVDDFLDVALNRSAVDWDGLEVAGPLRDLAERTWAVAGDLAHAPADPSTVERLDALRVEYADLYRMSTGVLADEREEMREEARQEYVERFAVKDERIARLRRRLLAAEAAQAAQAAQAA
ncbi:MAG: hypothetical protein JWN84_2689, partial [Nocardioides sp.]|nr:hypothetical protein [Nocardioides sp.]